MILDLCVFDEPQSLGRWKASLEPRPQKGNAARPPAYSCPLHTKCFSPALKGGPRPFGAAAQARRRPHRQGTGALGPCLWAASSPVMLYPAGANQSVARGAGLWVSSGRLVGWRGAVRRGAGRARLGKGVAGDQPGGQRAPSRAVQSAAGGKRGARAGLGRRAGGRWAEEARQLRQITFCLWGVSGRQGSRSNCGKQLLRENEADKPSMRGRHSSAPTLGRPAALHGRQGLAGQSKHCAPRRATQRPPPGI